MLDHSLAVLEGGECGACSDLFVYDGYVRLRRIRGGFVYDGYARLRRICSSTTEMLVYDGHARRKVERRALRCGHGRVSEAQELYEETRRGVETWR